MDLLPGTAPALPSAEVQEVPGLVPNQSIAGIGDPFVWSAADPALLLLQEAIHHLGNRQDVDRLSSVGSGSEFDVSLLRQLQRLIQTCWRWVGESPVGVFQDEAVSGFGLRVVEVERPATVPLTVPKHVSVIPLPSLQIHPIQHF